MLLIFNYLVIPTHDFLELPKWQPTEEQKMTCIKDHRKAQALLQTKSSYNLSAYIAICLL